MEGYDSRGLANLNSGFFDRAIADYTQALYYRPDLPTSLYGRGVAKKARGYMAGGDADMAGGSGGGAGYRGDYGADRGHGAEGCAEVQLMLGYGGAMPRRIAPYFGWLSFV
jgi:hypothetical protein